jgi:cysteine desulfurase
LCAASSKAGSKGNHIITTASEHHGVLNTCEALEREGFRATHAPVTVDGVVQIDAPAESICDETTCSGRDGHRRA